MEKIIFTNEEKKKIKESLNYVLDDIRELWNIAVTDKIDLEIGDYIGSYATYYLHITNSKVFIEEPTWDMSHHYNLETRIGKIINRIPSNYELTLSFIQNYESIRKKLIREIQKKLKKKDLGFSAIEEINKKYNKDAAIEIDFPETINKHSIEVSEENGKKVGIINFGNRTIKIITTGDIVLIDKKQIQEESIEEPTKIKKKKYSINNKK